MNVPAAERRFKSGSRNTEDVAELTEEEPSPAQKQFEGVANSKKPPWRKAPGELGLWQQAGTQR